MVQADEQYVLIYTFERVCYVFWSLFPIAGCNPVAIIKWGGWQEVRFLQAPPVLG
jgi:hypothetical protein